MPYSAGPNIAARPNLVFEYDLGDVQNSYKGEPTTNLVNPSWTAWSVDGSGQGNIGTRTIISPYYCQIVDNNANTRQYIYVEGISASTTYTFSVQYRSIAGAPTLRFQIQAYNGGSYISPMSFATTAQLGIVNNSEWQTAYITLTTPANTNRILWFMQDGDDYTTYTHAFELKNPQVEQKSHPTPFVVGTRSNTQGLLDVSGRGTLISLSNVSFTSTAQMTFDGTDDQINMDSYASVVPYGGSITVETLVQFNAFAPNDVVVAYGGNGTDKGFLLQYEFTSGLSFSVINVSTGGTAGIGTAASAAYVGKYTHMVGVYNQSQVILYLNGVNVASTNYTGGLPQDTTFRIGNEFARSYYSNMNLPVVRIYDSALSAQEVRRNYNQLKGRFNLP